MKKRVIIDTDPGVDDALALLLAFGSPELHIEAITTVGGNVSLDQATKNAALLLDLFDPTPRPLLAKGTTLPLSKKTVNARSIHGSDGLGELNRFTNQDGTPRYRYPVVDQDFPDAVEALLTLLRRYPDEITLITLGPLTNLAGALEKAETLVRTIKEVVIMGGALKVPGNITAAAEFNIFVDPPAAHRVFHSGLSITLVPLDVTEKVFLNTDDIQDLAHAMGEPLGGFLIDATAKAMEHVKRVRGTAAIHLHDPLAVAVAIKRSLVKTVPLHVSVETQRCITEGMTLADLRPMREDLKQAPNLQAALEVDIEGFLRFFKERLCQKLS